MALKAERVTVQEIQRSGGLYNMGTAAPGVVVCHYDNTQGQIYVETSGVAPAVPIGILTTEVDNNYTKSNLGTLTRPENVYKNVVGSGEPINILTIGVVTTDQIVDGDVPAAGSGAYVASSGKITTDSTYDVTVDDTGTYTRKQIGWFLSGKDSDGYAKIQINTFA